VTEQANEAPLAVEQTGILNFGSLNIDHVYLVDHIARPGETLASAGYDVFAGGKGANQSAALALAGARVSHCGRIGTDGVWLRDGLGELGVEVSGIVVDPGCRTGHAVIQVEASTGENAIFLYPGGNQLISEAQIETAFFPKQQARILLLQNEINNTPAILQQASVHGLTVCLNPAPFSPQINSWPLELVNLLILNQTEAAGLVYGLAPTVGAPRPDVMIVSLCRRWPQVDVLLTLGEGGAILCGPHGRARVDSVHLGPVLDTTAAGDTFIGYFLAARADGLAAEDCLRRAAVAAGICVTRRGARASIPRLDEVETTLQRMSFV